MMPNKALLKVVGISATDARAPDNVGVALTLAHTNLHNAGARSTSAFSPMDGIARREAVNALSLCMSIAIVL